VQKESVPACTSQQHFDGKCEQKSKVVDAWNVPTATETAHGSYAYGNLAQQDSVPACNSFQVAEGKCANKKSAADPYDLPTDNGKSGW
jgi:hypothetical protein